MSDPRQERLAAFVQWARTHVTRDEKGQAQIIIDRLFQAFGQRGSLEVGGASEMAHPQSPGRRRRDCSFHTFVIKLG